MQASHTVHSEYSPPSPDQPGLSVRPARFQWVVELEGLIHHSQGSGGSCVCILPSVGGQQILHKPLERASPPAADAAGLLRFQCLKYGGTDTKEPYLCPHIKGPTPVHVSRLTCCRFRDRAPSIAASSSVAYGNSPATAVAAAAAGVLAALPSGGRPEDMFGPEAVSCRRYSRRSHAFVTNKSHFHHDQPDNLPVVPWRLLSRGCCGPSSEFLRSASLHVA